MKRLTVFLMVMVAGVLCAQATNELTTPEAQALQAATEQSERSWWSVWLLGEAQMAAAAVALSLLINLRTLAYVFLLIYGLIVLNIPYYIPDKFKLFFGLAIIVMSVVGISLKLLGWLSKGSRKTPPPHTGG
jgi:hypothetical protein